MKKYPHFLFATIILCSNFCFADSAISEMTSQLNLGVNLKIIQEMFAENKPSLTTPIDAVKTLQLALKKKECTDQRFASLKIAALELEIEKQNIVFSLARNQIPATEISKMQILEIETLQKAITDRYLFELISCPRN